MPDIAVVEEDLADLVYVDLFTDAGVPVTPASTCTFEMRVGDVTYSTDCTLEGANRVSFGPTADMVANPGVYRARFFVDGTTYYPSNRSPYTVLVRPHTRGSTITTGFALLMETGDYLLMETGDRILLE